LFDEAVSEGMSRFRECRFSGVQNNTRNKNINTEPAEVTQRIDQFRMIVSYVGGKLCKFFVILKGEHGARVRREGGNWSRLERAAG
jgi:hypothetical protein